MRKSCVASLIAVGAISLPLMAGTTSAVSAASRTAPPIGTELVELYESGIRSVAISGTTVVVGKGPNNLLSGGGAYVFTKTAMGWEQNAALKDPATGSPDDFSHSVAISGSTAVVGAPYGTSGGRAYVFTKTTTGWEQVAELEASDTAAGNWFGWSVAISGTTVVVGAPNADFVGRAYVFTKTRTGWTQADEVKDSDTVEQAQFGWSVAVSGTTVVVGAPGTEGGAYPPGRAYVFTKTATGWKQVAELKPSEGGADDFGGSVAISGTTIVVGASYASFAGQKGFTIPGWAYVFTKTATGWKQAAKLKGSDTVGGDQFGASVAISGTTVVVGAPYADTQGGDTLGAAAVGRAYVFTKTATGWKQAAELDAGENSGGEGSAVASSGTVAVVGGVVTCLFEV